MSETKLSERLGNPSGPFYTTSSVQPCLANPDEVVREVRGLEQRADAAERDLAERESRWYDEKAVLIAMVNTLQARLSRLERAGDGLDKGSGEEGAGR